LHTLKTNTKVVRDKHNKARRLISIVVPYKGSGRSQVATHHTSNIHIHKPNSYILYHKKNKQKKTLVL